MNEERKTDRLAVVRSASLIALVFGAIGSVGLLRHAQKHPPPIIVAGFVVWVVAPFAVLGVAHFFSRRWPRRSELLFHVMTLVITLASLAIYLDDNIAHRTAKPAGVYVAVPPVTVILTGVGIAISTWQARKKRHE